MVIKVTFKSTINAEFLDQAHKELSAILLEQHLAFIDRWYSGRFARIVNSILRYGGTGLSIVGVLLSVFVMLNTPEWCPVWMHIELFLLFFLVAGLFFFFLPVFERKFRRWTEKNAAGQCRKRAVRYLAKAKKSVPFTAEYQIRGDLLVYFRGKDTGWDLAWHRRLRGVAFQGEAITVIFKKTTAITPSIILLHGDSGPLEEALQNLEIAVRPISDSD